MHIVIKRLTSVFFLSLLIGKAFAQITPETALQSYLTNSDNAYKWELKESFSENGVTVDNLLLTSQVWRGITWTHQLTVITPDERKYDGGLLFITGGSNKNELPNWSNKKNDAFLLGLMGMALTNKATVALVKQVPNQPLYDNLTEDALISYTLHNFKSDKDYSWPALFPMVKSAVKAMDAVQEFSRQQHQHTINRFTVSGASKRGWTTWLTGAINDKRVESIAPMVIDILNMPVSLEYQIQTWGDYSEEIQDYVKLGIPQSTATPDGQAISQMIDPYSYRANLTVPKMIFMGTNDPYWVVDNIKNYYKDIPGKNLIHYVPNAGHNLGGGQQAMAALGSFWSMALQQQPYPECAWEIRTHKKQARLSVKASPDILLGAVVWSADSKDKDFRDDKWSSQPIKLKDKSTVELQQPFPSAGYRAFYVDLRYQDSNGDEYTTSTRMFVTDTKKVFVQ